MLSEEERQLIEALYQQYYRTLIAISWASLDCRAEYRQLAEDIVQETFAAAMASIGRLRGHPSPRGWMITTCLHITQSKKRKIRNRIRILKPVAMPPDTAACPAAKDAIEAWIAEEALIRAYGELIGKLTPQEAAVYRSCYLEGKTARTTAEEQRLTYGAVCSTLRRIRRKIERMRGTDEDE